MFAQRDAIISLLRDDDPATVELVKNRLIEAGPASIAGLEDLAAGPHGEQVISHAGDALAKIRAQTAAAEFSALCHEFNDDGDIEAANWLLAGALLPGVDLRSFRATLDDWGAHLAEPIGQASSAREQVVALSRFLGEELGLTGNSEDYYQIANSLLPTVMESRRGLPISLSLLYMMVGRRAGVAVEGIGLPGHFIARIGDVLFDPFHGGRIIPWSSDPAVVGAQNLLLREQHLRPLGSLRLLIRILSNLHYVTEEIAPVHEQIGRWLASLSERISAE